MKRVQIALAAALLTLALAAAAETRGSAGCKGPECHADYHKKHGVKFAYGYYYEGQHHKHWSKRSYSPKWKCMFYYCPSARTWYYYYAPKKVYYPLSYIHKATPTVGGPAPGGVDAPPVPGEGTPPPPGGGAPKTAETKPDRPAPAPTPPAGPALTYEKNVLPILQRSCARCHNAGKKRAGLDLTTLAGITRGGDSGPAVQPSKPDDSLLYTKIVSGEMPLGGKKLADADIKLIRDWIASGARGK